MSKTDIYVYVGDGLGIPGLPHEVSLQEAERLGVTELLQEAIKAGKYKVRKTVEVKDD